MNDNFSKDPILKYGKHLSHFGRKVLNILSEQIQNDIPINSGNSCKINYRNSSQRTHHHNTYVHTDGKICSTDANSRINSSNNNIGNKGFSNIYDEQNSNDVNIEMTQKNFNFVPNSEELIKYNKEYVFQNDVENTTSKKKASDCAQANSFDIIHYKGDHLRKPPPTNSEISMEKVTWDDMFDNVLFSNNDYSVNESYNNEKNNSENDTTVLKKSNSSKRNKNQEKKSNIEDLIPKKIKKITKEIEKQSKNYFRKQKYTKTVKNWLNDVDMMHATDEVEVQAHDDTTQLGNENETMNSKKHNIQITFEKSSGEHVLKKTVQTKLSNDNGVMKFCKPKDIIKIDENEKNPVEINKDEKVKPKFLTPIKSQIPVKDSIYTVTFINDDSQNHIDAFRAAGEEIVMTLVYSDFCQLNAEYAQDIGAPQGIMILLKGTFFFLTTDVTEHREIILRLMGSNTVICYEGKNILLHLSDRFGLLDSAANLKILDAKIGGSLLDPDNPPDNFSNLQKLVDFTPGFTIATDCHKQKMAWYMCTLRDCWSNVQQALVAQGLWTVFVDIEMRVLPIIAAMEHRGICLDLGKLKAMEALLLERMKYVEQECYKAAGKTFQINSAVQVRTILYDELKLDSKCNVKIRETICQGAKSTSEIMLRSLTNQHPLPKLILEYRHLHKAHATFLSGIANCARDGVIRPIWEQSAASTGRIASSSPNIQAVPKTPFSLTLFPGESEGHGAVVVNLRSVYTSRQGSLLLAADFKQAECRVLAMAAADAPLLRALHSDDLFRVLAAEWMKKPEADVTGEERERTKRVVYASMYGAGASKLAEVLGRGYEHAHTVAASFNRTFPSLKSFGRKVVSQCERDGKLRTPCGRTRYFKDITSTNYAIKAQAERKAINFIIQGSAADLCKMAMVATEEQLRGTAPPLQCRLLLQIHDELVWEVRDEHLHTAAALIKTAMENCGHRCGLPILLPVALSCGRNWGEMKEFTPEI